jgi:hypothetical protein
VQHHIQQVADRAEQRVLHGGRAGEVGRAAVPGAGRGAFAVPRQRAPFLRQGRARRQQREIGGQARREFEHRVPPAGEPEPRRRPFSATARSVPASNSASTGPASVESASAVRRKENAATGTSPAAPDAAAPSSASSSGAGGVPGTHGPSPGPVRHSRSAPASGPF